MDIRPPNQPPPAGFEATTVHRTGGTMFPGMIELHNHLPYDVLSLWQVPKQYQNRDQWSGPGNPDYHRLITGPMQVLGADPKTAAAVVRFVETRCLLGGTTTSQGVTLATTPGLVTHFKGLVRNVENTGDPALPAAATHIADVAASDGQKFLEEISKGKKLILHLSEGTNPAAHNHFSALEIRPGTWAITDNLIGIHCVALVDADFGVLADHGGSMVWSPLSNFLLYGQTADLAAALHHHLPIALGSDWAPSGSTNLLAELKVARLAAMRLGVALTSHDLVAMVTRTPAEMIGWSPLLGQLAPGSRADLVLVEGTTADPYDALIDATEADLDLVMIDGVPRVGTSRLMGHVVSAQSLTIAGKKRVVDLTKSTADPDVATVSVAQAEELLTAALHDLPLQAQGFRGALSIPDGDMRLAVDGLVQNHQSSRPHLPYHGRLTGSDLDHPPLPAQAGPIAPLPSLTLDPLTTVDNHAYYAAIAAEANVPQSIRDGLVALGH